MSGYEFTFGASDTGRPQASLAEEAYGEDFGRNVRANLDQMLSMQFDNQDCEAIWELADALIRGGAHPLWAVVDAAIARDLVNRIGPGSWHQESDRK